MDPLRIPAVNLKSQYESIREEIDLAVQRVLERQDFIFGEEVSQLEQEMARRHGTAFAVGCASGSDALILALRAAGIGAGDSMLVPAFSFFATASAVVLAGARPVFVDIDPYTMNMSPEAVARALASETKARALAPAHLYGQCADMSALGEAASRRGMIVIEDAAQAVLARHRGRHAGSMGLAGCFSFYPTKNLSGAGDGGMVLTSDADVAERLRLLRNHGSPDKETFSLLGVNSRLDTLQAAILLVKLRHLDEWTSLRKEKASFYRRAFQSTNLVQTAGPYPTQDAPVVLPQERPESDHVYHQFTIRALDRDGLARHLRSAGIGTAVYYSAPLHRQPALATWSHGAACPEAERAAAEVLSLPLYPELTDSQQADVVDHVQRFYRRQGG